MCRAKSHGIDTALWSVSRVRCVEANDGPPVIRGLKLKITRHHAGKCIALGFFAAVCGVVGASVAHAQSQRIENAVAVFSALDKVTATIEKLEVPIGETTAFAALKVTPRVCLTSPATDQPKTTSFVQVEETQLDGSESRIFSGWMFAESPGLNAVEHPVFDVWLTGCKGPASRGVGSQVNAGDVAGEAAPARTPRQRRRRIRR